MNIVFGMWLDNVRILMMPTLLMHQYMTDYDLGTIDFPAQNTRRPMAVHMGSE